MSTCKLKQTWKIYFHAGVEWIRFLLSVCAATCFQSQYWIKKKLFSTFVIYVYRTNWKFTFCGNLTSQTLFLSLFNTPFVAFSCSPFHFAFKFLLLRVEVKLCWERLSSSFALCIFSEHEGREKILPAERNMKTSFASFNESCDIWLESKGGTWRMIVGSPVNCCKNSLYSLRCNCLAMKDNKEAWLSYV